MPVLGSGLSAFPVLAAGGVHWTDVLAQPWLAAAGAVCAIAAIVWARAAARLARAARRIEDETLASGTSSEAANLARSGFNKDLHAAILYAVLAAGLVLASFSTSAWFEVLLLGVTVPPCSRCATRPVSWPRPAWPSRGHAWRGGPKKYWPKRTWPPGVGLPAWPPKPFPRMKVLISGGSTSPGPGMMAGDFYDVFPTSPDRLAVVIGDVAGHGIEPSITAFQVKHVLRIFLRQYRDPAQALEELNKTLSTLGRPEDMVSCCIVIFDTEAATMRHASAGHPPAFVWQRGDMRPLRATGPLLALDPNATYFSRDLPLEVGDLVVIYTDGLTEARSGGQLFGEDRVAHIIRRDPGQDTNIVCKTLLEAARDFSSPLADDVAIMAIRRV